MSTFQPLATTDVLPNHPKLIRNALKSLFLKEKMLKSILGWHNIQWSVKPWNKPYGYVVFVGRILGENTDISAFEYRYNFQIGVVTELKTNEEDKKDDMALDMITIVESCLNKNKKILDTVLLNDYPMLMDGQQFPFLSNVRHYYLKVSYSQDIKYNPA